MYSFTSFIMDISYSDYHISLYGLTVCNSLNRLPITGHDQSYHIFFIMLP